MKKIYIATLMILLSTDLLAKEVLVDRIVSVVNNDIITLSDLKEAQRGLNLRKSVIPEEKFNKMAGSEAAVLNMIQEQKIILQYLKDNNLQTEKDDLDTQIKRRMKAFGMTQKDLEKELLASGQTINDLRNEIEVEQGKAKIFEKDLKRKISISEQDYVNFFQKEFKQDVNITEYKICHILVKEESLAAYIYKEAKSGTSFDSLAYKYSEDVGTKNNGGDLGYIGADSLLPEMKKTVENMSIGDIKGPIKTKLGYHVIKLDSLKTEKNPEYIKNKDMIERALVEKDFQRQLTLWLDEKKEEYYVRTYL